MIPLLQQIAMDVCGKKLICDFGSPEFAKKAECKKVELSEQLLSILGYSQTEFKALSIVGGRIDLIETIPTSTLEG